MLNVPINRALSLSPWFLHHRTWCTGFVWPVCLSVGVSYLTALLPQTVTLRMLFMTRALVYQTPLDLLAFSLYAKGSSEGPCYFVLQDRGMTLPNRGETFYVLFYFIFKGRPSKPNKYILRIWDKCFLNKIQVNPCHPTHSECHTVSSRVRKTKFTLKHQYFHTPWGEMLS